MKKWWGIRHLRWLWLSYRVHRWAAMWGRVGIGLGWPNESDYQTLDDIWAGRR